MKPLDEATAYLAALAFDRPGSGSHTCDETWFISCKDAASIHGLGPYLGLRVVAGEIEVPEQLAGWLVEQVGRNRERLTRLRSELLTVLTALEARGLKAIPVKGAALLLESVDAVAWRPFADLDLLVPEVGSQIQDVDLALARAGYCLDGTHWKHRSYSSCVPRAALVVGDGEHPDNPRGLDLHTSVVEMFRGFRWDLTTWLLADRREVAGWSVPSRRAMALHLAAHASVSALEGTARAINLVDLARALEPVGADTFFDAIRRAGLSDHARFVFPAIALTAREVGDPASRELEALLRPHVTDGMVGWAAAVSLSHISWGGRDDQAALDRQAIWARSRIERSRMLAHTLLPRPAVLASDAGRVDGPLDLPAAYLRHYRRLAGRAVGAVRDRSGRVVVTS